MLYEYLSNLGLVPYQNPFFAFIFLGIWFGVVGFLGGILILLVVYGIKTYRENIKKYRANWTTYSHDDNGRRVSKTAGGNIIRYCYAGNQVIAEYDGNDYYYAHDHLYSPAALTVADGNVVERYEYDAYGNCLVLEPNFAADPDGKSDYENSPSWTIYVDCAYSAI